MRIHDIKAEHRNRTWSALDGDGFNSGLHDAHLFSSCAPVHRLRNWPQKVTRRLECFGRSMRLALFLRRSLRVARRNGRFPGTVSIVKSASILKPWFAFEKPLGVNNTRPVFMWTGFQPVGSPYSLLKFKILSESSKRSMVRFPCPYCHHSLQPQSARAGLQRRCPRCQGRFLEPTDPLPGVTPEAIVLPEESDDLAANPSTDDSEATEQAAIPNAVSSVPKPDKSALSQFETRQLLQPLEKLNLYGLLIAWTGNREEGVKIGTTSGCPKEESEKVLLKAALQLIKSKSAELHSMVVKELARLDREDI
jgi:hypothetical protein